MNQHYKVSALCVSLCRRQLTDAYYDFKRQTHRNKELVLVFQGDDSRLPLEILCDKETIIVHAADGATLGTLRNRSIAEATGEYLIQWDDDDRYHPDRIARHLAYHLEIDDPVEKASVIDNFLLLDGSRLYWIDRRMGGMAGSILFGRNCPIDYPDEPRGEDQIVLNRLKKDKLCEILPIGITYLRVIHESNTWDRGHFNRMLECQMPEDITWAHGNDIKRAATILGVPAGVGFFSVGRLLMTI